MLPTPLLIDDADHGRGERRLAEVGYVADREPMPRSARPRPTLCLLGYTKCILLLFAESANQSFLDEEIRTKLTIAWRAAAARLIDAGHEPRDVYATMTSVAPCAGWRERSWRARTYRRCFGQSTEPPPWLWLPRC